VGVFSEHSVYPALEVCVCIDTKYVYASFVNTSCKLAINPRASHRLSPMHAIKFCSYNIGLTYTYYLDVTTYHQQDRAWLLQRDVQEALR